MIRTTKRKPVDYLKRIYHSSPYIIIKIFSYFYGIWMKIRSYWLPIQCYNGTAYESGNPMKISYIGWNQQVSSYWLGRIFDQYEQVPGKKLIPFWRINRYLKDKTIKCDLALVELSNKSVKRITGTSNGFVIPRWLKMYMDVDLSLSIIRKRGDIPRRIRKHSLEVEIGSSDQDFAFFYEKMYKPYIESRHQVTAIIEDYKTIFQGFKKNKSTIYFIVQDGRRIAGMYVQDLDGIPYMHGLGVLDGSSEIMKMGVLGALYYFALADHKENNIKRVNIGGTSPLLKDGLTMFKLFLGAKASEYQKQDSIRLKLLPMENTVAVKDFLTSNAFAYIENEHISCAIFKDDSISESEEDFQKLCKKTKAMKVKETKIFCFNTDNELSEGIPITSF